MNRTFAVKVTVLLVSMLTIMAGTPVSPALPKIAIAFAGEPHADLLARLVLTMPALFTVIGAPIAGIIADRFGRKPLVLVSLALYAVAGTSGFFADTLQQLLAGRALLGLAVGGCITAGTALITDYYQGAERIKLLGFQAAFTTGGGVLFISLGGFLAELGWRYPFLLYLVAVLVFALAVSLLYEPVRVQKALEDSSDDSLPLGFIAVIYLIALVGHTCFFSVPVQMPFFLQGDFGVGGVGTGLTMSLATLCASVTAFNYGRVKSRFSYATIIAVMFAMMSLGYVIIGLAPVVWVLVFGLCITGVAAGLLIPSVNNWISEITTSHNRGRAFGIITTSLFLGQFLAPIVMAPLVARVSYGTFFWVLGLFLLAMALVIRLAAVALGHYTQLHGSND